MLSCMLPSLVDLPNSALASHVNVAVQPLMSINQFQVDYL